MKIETECIACGNVKQFHEMCLSIKCTHVVDHDFKNVFLIEVHCQRNLTHCSKPYPFVNLGCYRAICIDFII